MPIRTKCRDGNVKECLIITVYQEIHAKNIHDFHVLLAICKHFLADLLVFALKQIKILIICNYFLAN